MKKLILAAVAVLALGAGAASAQSFSHNAPTNQQDTGGN